MRCEPLIVRLREELVTQKDLEKHETPDFDLVELEPDPQDHEPESQEEEQDES